MRAGVVGCRRGRMLRMKNPARLSGFDQSRSVFGSRYCGRNCFALGRRATKRVVDCQSVHDRGGGGAARKRKPRSIFAPSEVFADSIFKQPRIFFGYFVPFLRGGLGLLEDDGRVGLGRLDLQV